MAEARVVLVVADDACFALVRRICEPAGFVVLHASDHAAAAPLIERYSPDTVVTRHDDTLAGLPPTATHIVLASLDEHAATSALQSALARDATDPPVPRLALVVVEPDPQLADVMRRWLAVAFDVEVVTAGWRAIEAIRRRPPDAVLVELRVPDMDPAELHAALDREVPGLSDRALFMTGGFVADKSHQFLARIPGQWIHKPFDLAQLRAALAALVE